MRPTEQTAKGFQPSLTQVHYLPTFDQAGRCIAVDHSPDPEADHMEVQKMKLGKTASSALVISVLLVAMSGCQKQEGPAERAGKQVDKAMDQAGQQIEKAGKNVQDAAKGDK